MKEYKIRTLKDIFDLPLDKMKICLEEVAEGMIQAKVMQESLAPIATMEWPEESTWVDDDKGEIKLNLHFDGF